MDVEVEQPLAHLISHMLSGVTAQIAIKVYGDDLDTLAKLAEQIKAAIAGRAGRDPPAIEPIRRGGRAAHPPAARRPGLLRREPRRTSAEFVADRAAGRGRVAGARGPAAVRPAWCGWRSRTAPTTPTSAELRLDLPDGSGQVQLDRTGRHPPLTGGDAGANQVNRENVRRRIVIRCNAQGRDLAGVVADIQQRGRANGADAGGLLRRVRRAVREPAAGDAADRRPGRASRCVGMFVVLYAAVPVGADRAADPQRPADGVHRRRAGAGR